MNTEDTQNTIWIPKEIIPSLITIVENVIKKIAEDMLNGYESKGEEYDPNDGFIFELFVLPVLKDNLDKGFYSDELLDKGWMFLRLLMKEHSIAIE